MTESDTGSGATLHVRLERQLNALLLISRRWRRFEADTLAAFKNITESAAAALAVDRASIWIFDDDRKAIVCQDLYEYGRHRHTSGFKLTPADNAEYFTALERDEMISATDAHQHPSTRAFSKSYLKPHGIGAMLDVPIRVDGELTGVLCHEHVGGSRLFLADEQTTARLLAHLASLACEISGRQRSKAHAAWQYALTQAAVDSAGLGVFATTLEGKVAYVNTRLLDLWGMSPELASDAGGGGLRLDFTADRVRDREAFVKRMNKLIEDPSLHLSPLRVELKDGRTLEIGSCPQRVDGNILGRVWTVRELPGE